MTNIDSGMNAWRRMTNHNRMMEFQRKASLSSEGPVELACSKDVQILRS